MENKKCLECKKYPVCDVSQYFLHGDGANLLKKIDKGSKIRTDMHNFLALYCLYFENKIL